MSHRPVPADHVRELAEHAARAGALLLPVTDQAMRGRLAAALADAAAHQHALPGYATELRQWTSRYPGGRDGVPAANIARTPIGATVPSPLRPFPNARLTQPPSSPSHPPADDAADLLVIATPGDDTPDRLRAGEATSAVLLAATRLGLATTPLSQAVEIDSSRQRLRSDVLRIPEHPQLLIRVGWPAAGAAEIAPTPRRSLRSTLLP